MGGWFVLSFIISCLLFGEQGMDIISSSPEVWLQVLSSHTGLFLPSVLWESFTLGFSLCYGAALLKGALRVCCLLLCWASC